MSKDIQRLLKVCCVAALIVVAFVGLGPATWQPCSGFGWELDHFAGYFVITSICCLAWPRPFKCVSLAGLRDPAPQRAQHEIE
jgi:hypothetical protein